MQGAVSIRYSLGTVEQSYRELLSNLGGISDDANDPFEQELRSVVCLDKKQNMPF